MVYFIFGEDSYRSKQKVDEMITGYKKVHPSGLNFLHVDAKEKSFEEFLGSLQTHSMFREKKLAVLNNAFENKKFQEALVENIKNLQELKDIIIVYEKDSVDHRTKLFKSLEKSATCQEFHFLQPAMLKKWALQEFEKYHAAVDNDALDLLLTFVKNDLWRMSNEINKLSLYKKGSAVKKEDVILQVKPDIENDIFKTIEALAAKNKKLALVLLHNHLDEGEVPLYLLSMIAYQFRNLIIIKELLEKGMPYQAIAKKAGLHPFVVQKTYAACRQFSLLELKKIYRKIFQIDSEIKTGSIEPETALDLLVAQI